MICNATVELDAVLFIFKPKNFCNVAVNSQLTILLDPIVKAYVILHSFKFVNDM